MRIGLLKNCCNVACSRLYPPPCPTADFLQRHPETLKYHFRPEYGSHSIACHDLVARIVQDQCRRVLLPMQCLRRLRHSALLESVINTNECYWLQNNDRQPSVRLSCHTEALKQALTLDLYHGSGKPARHYAPHSCLYRGCADPSRYLRGLASARLTGALPAQVSG